MTGLLLRRVDTRPIVRVSVFGWDWPDWTRRHPDKTFGNRFDDPAGDYRVSYMARREVGAYLETLAWARPDPAVAVFAFSPGPGHVPTATAGSVPRSWFAARQRLTGRVSGRFAAIGHSASMSWLRDGAHPLAGAVPIDGSMIRGPVREVTQAISRVVYQHPRAPDGIAYASRHGEDQGCMAVFERGALSSVVTAQVSTGAEPSDPGAVSAMRLLGITVAP